MDCDMTADGTMECGMPVHDDGSGMDADYRADLYDLFDEDIVETHWLAGLGVMPRWLRDAEAARGYSGMFFRFVDSCLRGAGQAVLMNNPLTGLCIIVGALLFSPWHGVVGVVALVAGSACGVALDFPYSAYRQGLYSFNALLVGLGIVFYTKAEDWEFTVLLISIMFAGISTWVHAMLTRTLAVYNLAALTLSFNICVMIYVLMLELIPDSAVWAFRAFDFAADPLTDLRSLSVQAVLSMAVRGFGQIFFLGQTATGALVLLGILLCSPLAALMGMVGAVVGGAAYALTSGPSASFLLTGLASYNSVLTAVAVGGVFMRFSWLAVALAVGAAAVSSLCTVGFELLTGLPALTVPFCVVTLLTVSLQHTVAKRIALPLRHASMAEAHVFWYQQVAGK